jgi:hypothetical protein
VVNRWIASPVSLVVALFSAGAFSTPARAVPRTLHGSDSCRAWRLSQLPVLPTVFLTAIDGSGPDDVWAIGYDSDDYTASIPFHWDGTRWSFETLHPGGFLFTVVALTPTDAWAVGLDYSTDGPFFEHWDGARWTRVDSPGFGSMATIASLTDVSPTDIWAGGLKSRGSLTEHWDGIRWRIVRSPPGSVLDLSAVASDDVWGVGNTYGGISPKPWSMHWDGSSWSTIPTPAPTSGDNALLRSVSTVASDDVWAVGYDEGPSTPGPFFEHWDGAAWSIVPSPPTPETTQLMAISAVDGSDIWASGQVFFDDGNSGVITEHWDGNAWTVLRAVSPNDDVFIYDLVALSHTDIWTVGGYVETSTTPLAEHSSGPCPAGSRR